VGIASLKINSRVVEFLEEYGNNMKKLSIQIQAITSLAN
jgi:hypothetical protein